MKKFAAIVFCLAVANVSFAEVTGSVTDDGFIMINAVPAATMAGLNLQSPGGYLVPIPPGTTAAPAAPFQFLLANSNKQVTYASLGAGVVVDGDLKTAVGYSAPDGTNDISAAWGDGPNQVAFAVTAGAPAVPEPAAGILAALGALGVLGFRRRR